MFGQAQHKSRHQQAFNVGVLVGNVKRVLIAGAVVASDGSAGLHGVGGQAVVDQVELGHMCSACKYRIDSSFFADGPFVAVVVRCLGVQGRSCFCVAHIDDGGQNVVLDFYQFSGIFGLLEGFSHHHRHMIAHITHFAVGQDGVRGLLHGLTAGVRNQPAARKTVDLGVYDVGAIQNSHHTWRG